MDGAAVLPAMALAQSVEHETLNLGVVGSSPTLGVDFCCSLKLMITCNCIFYDL